MNRKHTAGVGLVLALGLFVTSCGSDSGSEAGSSTAPSPAATTAAATASETAAAPSATTTTTSAGTAGCDALKTANPDLVGKNFDVGTSPGAGNYNNPDPDNANDVTGLEPEVLRAAATCLGFTVKFFPQSFDGLIPAITSKRIDLISSGMYATPERAKKVSFVEHMTAATAALLPRGNPKNINSLADTCGLKIAESTGTVENEIQAKQDEACKAAGKKPSIIATYSGNDQPANAVRQGRSDYFLTDAGVAAQLGEQFKDKLQVGFAIPSEFAFGYGVDKTNDALLKGLYAALKQFYEDGTLAAAQQKWGFSPSQRLEPRIVTG